MANKLKKMHLTSVDLVRAGANQEADICLFKSATPSEATETPTENETSLFKRFINRFKKSAVEPENELTDTEMVLAYTEALEKSVQSIREDNTINDSEKVQLLYKSFQQFNCAVTGKEPPKEDKIIKSTDADRFDVIEEVAKANPWHGKDGRFTSGPGGAAGGVAHRTIANGGISYHVKSGKEPKDGYMCAVYTDRSTWLKGDDVKDPEKRTAAIKDFMNKNKDVLSDPDNYLGTWYDTSTGNISLDISRNFSDKNAAIKFASEHNEKAIWDVKNMTEISTGGTGNNI